MGEGNFERFNILVDEFLKVDSKYKLQIENFRDYLDEYKLTDKVFNLYETNIDEFFKHAMKKSIGTKSQLVSHIAALKSLFNYFIDNNLKFSDLNGYISNPAFKEKYSHKVDEVCNKDILSIEMINKILNTMDLYISNQCDGIFRNKSEEAAYLHVLIARLFIKVSLLLPLKTSQVLEIKLGDVYKEDWREIYWNDVKVKVPNNLRKDILFTLGYVQNKFGKKYTPKVKIFELLYSCEGKKNSTDSINATFPRVYKRLQLNEMLETTLKGKKNNYRYPAESYKKTAITNMLSNGANIVYLIKLTGLDAQALLVDFDYGNLNDWDVTRNINSSLLACSYYEYL
ncbi:MAG: hypothetical protein H2184_13260 [Candidatus Galacturonibacter soehngenii]|nr:hypothetical protein [Candidatus Galacturonibacter soehngenii]